PRTTRAQRDHRLVAPPRRLRELATHLNGGVQHLRHLGPELVAGYGRQPSPKTRHDWTTRPPPPVLPLCLSAEQTPGATPRPGFATRLWAGGRRPRLQPGHSHGRRPRGSAPRCGCGSRRWYPSHEAVDQAVAAAAGQVVGGEAQPEPIVRVVGQ